MNCLIIDDDSQRIRRLKQQLKATGFVDSIHSVVHFYQAKTIYTEQTIDAVFVAVRLWNHRWVQGASIMPGIIFLTEKKERLLPEPHVLLSLHDTATQQDVLRTVIEIDQGKGLTGTDFLFIRFERKLIRIRFGDIELVERKTGNYYVLYTKEKGYLLPGSLNAVLHQLPEKRFERISDTLIIPVTSRTMMRNDAFDFRGRKIEMTYRFMRRQEAMDADY